MIAISIPVALLTFLLGVVAGIVLMILLAWWLNRRQSVKGKNDARMLHLVLDKGSLLAYCHGIQSHMGCTS